MPLAVIGVVGAALLLRNRQRVGKIDPLDIPGVVLSVAGLVSLVYGLSTAESKGWSSATTLTFIGLGVLLLAVFVFAETRSAHPLLPMRILLDRNRAGSYVAVGLVGAGLFGVFLFLTYYLSTLLAYTPLKTGVSFLPMIIGLVIVAAVARAWSCRTPGPGRSCPWAWPWRPAVCCCSVSWACTAATLVHRAARPGRSPASASA